MLAPEVVRQSLAHKAAYWQDLAANAPQSPLIHTATPTRQQRVDSGLLRSAIVNSAASTLSPLSASANAFRPKMQIHTSGVQHKNFTANMQQPPMTAMTPNAPSRRPPGLSVQTSSPTTTTITKQMAPQSAPVRDDFKHGQDIMESIVRRVMHVDLGDSLAARNSKLARLLDMLELNKYKQVMQEHEVDFDMFLQLTEADMRELGIPMGPRKKMTQAIAEIRLHRALDNSVQSAIVASPRHQRANTFSSQQHLAPMSPST